MSSEPCRRIYLLTTIQCVIPCFEGLLPEPYNKIILDMLYSLAYWHGLAKMRLHTESSVTLLDDAHTAMMAHLRIFTDTVCPAFDTWELPRESEKRARAQAVQQSTTQPRSSTASGRKRRSFHLRTVKTHLLGYYPAYIRRIGTSDSYSTNIVSLFLSVLIKLS